MRNGKNGPPANGHEPPRRRRPTVGRPPVLDELVTQNDEKGQPHEYTRSDLVVLALQNGSGVQDALRFAGINTALGEEFLRTGRRARERWANGNKPARPLPADTRNVDFLGAVEFAQAQTKLRLIMVVMNAALESPRWAAWMLAKLDPRTYGATITLKTERDDVIRDAEKVAGLLGVAPQPVIDEALQIYDGAGGPEL